ncbi:MAG: amino acid adenylation domain-containing protein [Acidobacteria bacterium]|nr:amino acid adenylation domain-containing protein [Acidobacteriota bacterium]
MTTEAIEAFRMSPQQRQAWSSWQGSAAAVPCRAVVELTGRLEPERLRAAVALVARRHESLRTLYRRQAGMRWPLQVPVEDLPVAWAEGATLPALDPEAGPVLAAAVEALGSERHRLVLEALPLAADAASLKALVAELATAYHHPAALQRDDEPLQFVQFSEWQLEVAEETLEDGAAALLPEDADTEPPLPRAAPATGGEAGHRVAQLALSWPAGLAEALARQAAAGGASEAAWLLAVWRLVLGGLAGGRRVVVEVSLDGRKFEECEGAVGRFARRAPVELEVLPDFTAAELVRRTQGLLDQAREHQELLGNRDACFAGAVGFEMLPEPESWRAGDVAFALLECRDGDLPMLCGLRSAGSKSGGVELVYDSARLAAAAVESWGEALLVCLAAALGDPATEIRRLPRLGKAEHAALFHASGLPLSEAREDLPLERIAQWVESDPERVALRGPSIAGGSRRVSYGELWAEAGRLAAALRSRGVGPGQIVGLLLERSVETVVAMVGAWRAGAAYLPLDPSLPASRLEGLLEAAAVRQVVTDGGGRPRVPEGVSLMTFDDVVTGGGPPVQELGASATDLAYVLFTSGSTGQPKGVLVTQGNLAAYVAAAETRLGTASVASWMMASTFAADLGLTGVLLGLVAGASIHVATAQEASDPSEFARRMSDGSVAGLKIVPSHLAALLSGPEPAAVLPRRLLVVGGEACPPELVERVRGLAPALEIFNHYGPTETTIGVVAGEVPAPVSPGAPVPLGRPLAHAFAVLCDRWGEPVAHGVEGELYLGGRGLARGYLARPAATAERFVPDFWSGEPGARLYRTGDRARLDAESRLVFAGRVDHQVKLRGYRVELGEVEAVLAQHPQVRQAVVDLREEERGSSLVAYVAQRPGSRLPEDELRRHLASRLPDYMLPRAFVVLDALPINANGKIDRRALPEPEQAAAARLHVEPESEVQRMLVGLWQQALGIERIGIRDDFFALGGDSIVAIQLIGKAARQGLRFTPQQLFEHRTIEELAPWVGSAAGVAAEQGTVAGELPLAPIQRWFFAGARKHPEHFNQSLLLATREPLVGEVLRRVLTLLARHHDVLRCRFPRAEDGRRRAEILPEAEVPLAAHDLSALAPAARRERLERLCADAQTGFDLEAGPLFRALSFDLGDDGGRLLLASHHLLVDGVSWRLLVADLEEAYGSFERGETPELPAKTTSFLDWARALETAVAGGGFDDQLDLWLAATEGLAERPRDELGGGPAGSSRRVFRSLDGAATRALLQEVPPVYNTQINDALLAALALAHDQVFGRSALVVELEGHGREPVVEGVDLSRTVGWFTTHFPVRLDVEGARQPGAALVRVKETLRGVPQAGIGYGLLRWLGEGVGHRRLRERPDPAVSFNYLGQLDGVLDEAGKLGLASESSGPERAPDELRSHRFEVSGSVLEGRLQLAVTFSPELDEPAVVERWLAATGEQLLALVEHCRDPEAGGFTPSDFPLAELEGDELDRISGLLDSLDDETEGSGA